MCARDVSMDQNASSLQGCQLEWVIADHHAVQQSYHLDGGGAIHNTDEKHSYVQTGDPVRKDERKILAPNLGKSKIQRTNVHL